jgi:peptide/nickel transport system permease protein
MSLSIIRRAASAFVSLWAILTIAYACLYLVPGDPGRIILGPQASAQTVLEFRRTEGLDQPWTNQYLRYAARTARLDFGHSFSQRRPVTDLLVERAGASLSLTLIAALLSITGGVLLPLVLKSAHYDKLLSVTANAFQLAAFIPPYVLAIGALLLFAFQLHWASIMFASNQLSSWIVAATVLAAYPVALLLQVFVGRLNYEQKRPYARRALAQGFSGSHQLWREVLPNALPTALAVFTNNLAFFVTGAFFVEIIFGIPGLGRLAQQAIEQKDIPVLSGVCITIAVFVLLLSFGLDIASRFLSPRVNENAN